jgi:hypothetical protein
MSRRDAPPWSYPIRLIDVGRLDRAVPLSPDEAARKRIASTLDLADLPTFDAEVRLEPWLDGVQLDGRWRATVVYRCGLTLEPFEARLDGRFVVRAVPPHSPQAADGASDVELDLEADDPPDVLDGDVIDVGAYLVEHLALELDPFPRKPGAVFDAPPAEEPPSPFAVLSRLRPAGEDEKG